MKRILFIAMFVLFTRDAFASDALWYIISSRNPGLGGSGIGSVPWGWVWQGAGGLIGGDLKVVPGDYDGDGISDLAIVNKSNGTWYIVPSSNPSARGILGVPWGWVWQGMGPDFDLVPGDYDGDGKTDLAIVNRRNGTWYIIPSKNNYSARGIPGVPWGWVWQGMGSDFDLVPGDYDGDGKTDLAIVNRRNGTWYIIPSKNNYSARGIPGVPWGWVWQGMGPDFDLVPGDYDGDGKTDLAIVNRRNGTWYIIPSKNDYSARGIPGVPWGWVWQGMGPDFDLVPGDYDGDGKTDLAIVNRLDGTWYIIPSKNDYSARGIPGVPWGWVWQGMGRGHIPVPGDYDGDGKTDLAIVGATKPASDTETYGGGLIGDALTWLSFRTGITPIKDIGRGLDKVHADFKESVKFYGNFEKDASALVRNICTQSCATGFQVITNAVITSCSNWDGRTDDYNLIDDAIKRLVDKKIFEQSEFDGIQIRWCALQGADGMAPDRRRIYLDAATKSSGPKEIAANLAHEMKHIRQYKEMGTDNFKCTYTQQYVGCGGCQDIRHQLEREAYEFVDSIRKDL